LRGIDRICPGAWGSRFLSVGAKGDINSASALGTWPEGQALVEGLIAER
jgi:predicted alpha/beta hydrolase family esterase